MSWIRLSVTQLSCLSVPNIYISALAISIDADSMHGFYFTLPFTNTYQRQNVLIEVDEWLVAIGEQKAVGLELYNKNGMAC